MNKINNILSLDEFRESRSYELSYLTEEAYTDQLINIDLYEEGLFSNPKEKAVEAAKKDLKGYTWVRLKHPKIVGRSYKLFDKYAQIQAKGLNNKISANAGKIKNLSDLIQTDESDNKEKNDNKLKFILNLEDESIKKQTQSVLKQLETIKKSIKDEPRLVEWMDLMIPAIDYHIAEATISSSNDLDDVKKQLKNEMDDLNKQYKKDVAEANEKSEKASEDALKENEKEIEKITSQFTSENLDSFKGKLDEIEKHLKDQQIKAAKKSASNAEFSKLKKEFGNLLNSEVSREDMFSAIRISQEAINGTKEFKDVLSDKEIGSPYALDLILLTNAMVLQAIKGKSLDAKKDFAPDSTLGLMIKPLQQSSKLENAFKEVSGTILKFDISKMANVDKSFPKNYGEILKQIATAIQTNAAKQEEK